MPNSESRNRESIPALLDSYRKLSESIVKVVFDRFPRGTVVHWVRRGYRQRGEVTGVLGFQAHMLRLRVLNTSTGKLVDIYLNEIEETSRG